MSPERARPEKFAVRFETELKMLLASGENAPGTRDKLMISRMIRSSSPDCDKLLDDYFIRSLAGKGALIDTLQNSLGELKQLCEELTAPRRHKARFLRLLETEWGTEALVVHEGRQIVVGLASSLDPNSLESGAVVALGKELNVIMGTLPLEVKPTGETGLFERFLPDGRMVVSCDGKEQVMETAAGLQDATLNRGDKICCGRLEMIAYEVMENDEGTEYITGDFPDEGRECVGGQEEVLEKMVDSLTAVLVDPELAATYNLSGRRSILLEGPPGCGKTLRARVAAAEITRRYGERCSFFVVKPAEWLNKYLGVSEERIRATFGALNRASENGPAILFLDEVESLSSNRDADQSEAYRNIRSALQAELDGFSKRGRVGVIAATNRKDLIDSAMLERLTDMEIRIERPGLDDARAIFNVHLPETVPFAKGETETGDVRREIVETAISMIYAPNAGHELCTLKLRDGTSRTVSVRELVSGRLIERICQKACQTAFYRDLNGGEPGLHLSDMERAVAEVTQGLRTTITPMNARQYLEDLPHDMDVLRVEPVVRKVREPRRYRILEMS